MNFGMGGALERVGDGGHGIEGIWIILTHAEDGGRGRSFVFHLCRRLNAAEELTGFGAGEEIPFGVDGECRNARICQTAVEKSPALARIGRMDDPGVGPREQCACTVDRQGADSPRRQAGVKRQPVFAVIGGAEEAVLQRARVDGSVVIDDQASDARCDIKAGVDGAPGGAVVPRAEEAVRPRTRKEIPGGRDGESADV